jgi:hypothetical protein
MNRSNSTGIVLAELVGYVKQICPMFVYTYRCHAQRQGAGHSIGRLELIDLSGGKAKLRDKVDRIVPLCYEYAIRIGDPQKEETWGKTVYLAENK